MDLSKLSDSDLMALKSGDLTKVSDAGLMHLKGQGAPAPAKAPAEPTIADQFKQGMQNLGNTAAGMVRGAGSIGATVLAPYDMLMDKIDPQQNLSGLITGKQPMTRNEQRRADMDNALASMGAQPESGYYGAGKLGTEIAGTLGVGGGIANVLGRAPVIAANAPNVLNAIRTAGMTAGTGGNALVNLGTRAAGGAITGGASAGLVNPDDAMRGAAIGGALPVALKAAGAAGKAIGAGAKAAIGAASPEVSALASRAKELGIDIPADRIVNSKPLDAIASGLNYVPFSGRAATEAQMNSQLNQALSRTFGQDSSNVTMALRKANGTLGGEFERVLSKNGVNVDQQFLTDIADVFNKAEKELGSDALKPIAAKVDDLMEKAGSGVIDGKAAYNIKRDLDRIGGANTPTAWHAIELKKKLMDALDRSLGPDAAKAFAKTREQYGNMLDLEKLAKNGVEGELSVARIANIKDIGNKPLQEIADIAAQFVKPREGQHGAMQRAVVGLTGASLGGLPGLAGGAAVGRAGNMALNSNALRGLVSGAQTPNALSLSANPDLVQLGLRAAPVLAGSR